MSKYIKVKGKLYQAVDGGRHGTLSGTAEYARWVSGVLSSADKFLGDSIDGMKKAIPAYEKARQGISATEKKFRTWQGKELVAHYEELYREARPFFEAYKKYAGRDKWEDLNDFYDSAKKAAGTLKRKEEKKK